MNNVQTVNLGMDHQEGKSLLAKPSVANHFQSKYLRVGDLVEAGSLQEDLLVECLAEMAKFFYEAGEKPWQAEGKKVNRHIVREKAEKTVDRP